MENICIIGPTSAIKPVCIFLFDIHPTRQILITKNVKQFSESQLIENVQFNNKYLSKTDD